MDKRYNKTLFLFHRDLRVFDNTGLGMALKESDSVLPAFVFDPRQLESHPYKSENALEFMIASLKELSYQIEKKGGRLYLLQGETEKVVSYMVREEGVDSVFANRDYTPFSRRRDEAVRRVCLDKGADFRLFGDSLLNEPEHITKPDGSFYSVYTAFYNASQLLPVRMPEDLPSTNYFTKELTLDKGNGVFEKIQPARNPNLGRKGGRSEALKILKKMGRFRKYEKERDIPSLEGTTGLSPHNKFGTLSIREFYHAVRDKLSHGHPLVRQLYWRDFFSHIGFHHDRVFGHAFHNEYDFLPWDENPAHFAAWKEGRTGFPIVDAGMRELSETGTMHNRVRMIAASFLVKDLHIDWREGERFFATQLTDYDPCVNNGNWQWAASTGCDATPYFRIFNPWIQQKKFDPEALYIKKWLPELADVPAEEIHGIPKRPLEEKLYPRPIADHGEESKRSLEIFRYVKAGNYPKE